MSDTKLLVMHKKFIKLLRTSLPKYFKQKAHLFGIINFDTKNSLVSFSKEQRLKFRKFSDSVCRNFLKRRQRYLSVSNNPNFNQYSDVTSYWKSLLSQVLEEKKWLSTSVWSKVTDDIVAKVIDGKGNRSFGYADTCDQSLRSVFKERNKDQTVTGDAKHLSEQYKNIKNQAPQTEAFSRDKPILNPIQERKGIQELPLPHKCRLSCPLPPPEFYLPEAEEYHQSYQSPNVRFMCLPEEFLPKKKVTPQNSKNHTMRVDKQFSTKEKKSLRSSGNIDLLDAEQKNIKNKKNYLNLMNIKSQMYKPPSEVIPKMKALLFEPLSLALNFDVVDVPTKIFKNEVLVQVIYSGVCGTDIFITEGKLSYADYPIILGHEISGKVYAAGSGVTHVKPGDNVVVNAYTSCGVCRYCSRGLYSACENEGLGNSIGTTKNGGWAEFVVVKKSQVHKIPEQLDLDQAALIQPLSCILTALSKLDISHGMKIFIQGLGLSGCLWASVLHLEGHKNVFVSDKSEKKRQQFESINTNYTFVPPEDIGKQDADIIIECTGSSLTIEKSLNILNPRGQMCFFEKPHPMTEIRCIPYEIIQKEITITGNGANCSRFSEAIHMATTMGPRYLNFENLGVQTFDLEDYKKAFHMKKTGKVNKIIFKFES